MNENRVCMLHWELMNRKTLTLIFLITGLALVLTWFGIDKFRNGYMWVGFLPLWTDGFLGVSRDVWLIVIGILELVFAALIIIPVRRVRQIGATLIVLHFLSILSQVGINNDIGMRDTGLLFMSMSLLALL